MPNVSTTPDARATITSHMLGYMVCSPPLHYGVSTGNEQFMKDFAIFEVNKAKIDTTNRECGIS
jgi:hypothetical protein